MRYLVSLLLGIVSGAALAVGFLYYNPLNSHASLSPLEVSGGQQLVLNYPAVAKHSLLVTNDGESPTAPVPEKVLQLWEGPIRQTEARVAALSDTRGNVVGLGIKFSSASESTRVLRGEVLVDSVWFVYLPGKGTFLIEQSENHWRLLRDVVVPAHWSSGNGWKGNWRGTVTHGPGTLGTARVHGGSGEFQGQTFDAIESLHARAYSTDQGAVAMDGQLSIELPAGTAATR